MASSPAPETQSQKSSASGHLPAWLTVVVLVVAVGITTTLSLSAASIHQHNEARLLQVELGQAASVVSVAIPSIESPLTSAVDLAALTNGSASGFLKYMGPYVGGGSLFVSASLWHVTPSGPTPVATVGKATSGAVPPGGIAAFVLHAKDSTSVDVSNLLGAPNPTIAYAVTSQVSSGSWVVFGNTVLPKSHKLSFGNNPAFAQLKYAIYLGSVKPANLLAAGPSAVPLSAAKSESIALGNTQLIFVAAPDGELGGTLLARLPWIVGIVGGVLAVIAALMTEYLIRRRRQAESLASENRRMYREQRSIAEILQHALLPQALPDIKGVETAARYVAGREGTDVGGDWYDVIPIDETRFVFVVGDVSGHGVGAATIMARLHFAIRAYAAQGDSPELILEKLGHLLSLERDRSFATILCGVVNVIDHSITIVNAGHPPLLLLNGSTGDFVKTNIFPPVGVVDSTNYEAVTINVPEHSTILAFTDGLVERRGEIIDVGLERLRSISTGSPLVLDDLLSKLLVDMSNGGYNDDMAILAVRWRN
jgi:serine phosphatase RsbU (regulator of sigma subunit)